MKKFLTIWVVVPIVAAIYTQLLQPGLVLLGVTLYTYTFPIETVWGLFIAVPLVIFTPGFVLIYEVALVQFPIYFKSKSAVFPIAITYYGFFYHWLNTGQLAYETPVGKANFVLYVITGLFILGMVIMRKNYDKEIENIYQGYEDGKT